MAEAGHNGKVAKSDDGVGFSVTCSCGWLGNNPYPDNKGAKGSLTKHYEQVGASNANTWRDLKSV